MAAGRDGYQHTQAGDAEIPACTEWSDMWQLRHAPTSLDTVNWPVVSRSFYLYLIENCLIPLRHLPCGTTRQPHVALQTLACSFTDSFVRFISLRSTNKEIHHEHKGEPSVASNLRNEK